MKKINRIFFQILALAIVLSSAVSNAFAQGSMCINAYMVKEESCSPGEDGIATVFIPTALSGKCSIEWNLGNGQTSSSEMVSGLKKGSYSVTVRSNTCSNVVFYTGSVTITKNEECDVQVEITGQTSVEIQCNEIPNVTFTATASGGVPPYTFSGWTQVSNNTAIKTIHPGEGHFSVTCIAHDSEGNYGSDYLDGYAKKPECAEDPNEIRGPAGYDEEIRFVNNSDKMNYTIEFENDPDFAMAPASRVKITYDVPDKQKLASFRLADFGFGDFIFTVPSNVSSYSQRLDVSDSLGVWVDVNAGIDIVNNQLFWIFQSIDPATGAEPVSSQMGFLPINDSLEHGQGYVSFYIAPDTNVRTGDTVSAAALIVFDDNAPIGTNVWKNTFDAVAPTSILHAEMNSSDSLYCTFSFETQDDPQGSGVRDVEVYMSVNDASYISIGSVNPDSTLSFVLENGVYYQFMSIATDNVGNKEAFKAQPDTAINYNTAPIDLVLNGNTFYEYDPINTTIGTFYTLDNDVNLPFVYTLVPGEGSDDNALFTIEGNVLKTDTTFVCSRQTEYSVRVRTTDIGGLYYEASFILHEVIQHQTPTLHLNVAICEGSSIDFYGRELTQAGTYKDTVQTPEGCDSIIVWYLTVNPTYNNTPIDTVVCDQFVWNDSTYTESGVISHTYTLATGCDSTVTYNLTVNPSFNVTDEQTICANQLPINWNGVLFEEAGVDTAYLQTVNGCDSMVVMTLHVNPVYSVTNEMTICASELPYVWDNVTFNEAGTLVDTLETVNGCDSVVTKTLYVNPIYNVTDAKTICASELPYEWNGVTFTEAGTQEATLMTVNQCDSVVTMTLTVNPIYAVPDTQTICASELPYAWNNVIFTEAGTQVDTLQTVNGCDSVVTMTLHVNPIYNVPDEKTICASELPYAWNNVIFTEAGTQVDTLQTVNGCDSVVTMTLHVNPIYNVTDEKTICASELPYAWNNVTFTEAGTQIDTLQTVNGCDSVVTMTLTVNPIYNVTDAKTICASELPYAWNNVIFTEAGTQVDTLQTVNGCDSVVTMTLTVNPIYNVTDAKTICASELPYAWNNVTFTEAGTQVDTLQTVNGCDSVVTMTLTVNPTYNVTDEKTICASELPYAWNNVVFEQAGVLNDTLPAANGCDSVIVMTLTVNPIYSVTETHTICASELPHVWNNITFTEAGTQVDTMQTVDGCDSVVTMILIVNPIYDVTDTQTVCVSALPYTWNGVTFTAAGTQTTTLQTVNGCDSVVTMTLAVTDSFQVTDTRAICENELPYTWNGHVFAEAGTATVTLETVNGCDSTVTMILTVNPTYQVTDARTICASELPYIWNGVEFTQAGTQTGHLQAVTGCDSAVTMTLTVNPIYQVAETKTICPSELPYTWNNVVFEQAGEQNDTLQTVNGCDSVVTMTLALYPTYEVTDAKAICASELPYTWNEVVFTEAGTQTTTLQTVNGCDSVVTMTLTVNPIYQVAEAKTICPSELPYTWNNVIFSEAGTQVDTLETVNGCDSVVTMTLTLYPSYNVTDAQTICASELPYTWNGVEFTQAGSQTVTLQTVDGCDSVVTMTLTVNPIYQVADTKTICPSELPYTWNNVVFEQAGEQVDTLETVNGCDSVVTMTLALYPTYEVTDAKAICASELPYTWNEVVFTEAGTQVANLQTVNGCDSVVTMTLTVTPIYQVADAKTICPSELPYTWNNVVFEQAGVQVDTLETVNGCDSIVTMTLTLYPSYNVTDAQTICASELPYTWNGVEFTQAGSQTVTLETVDGCDSVVNMTLNVNPIYNVTDEQSICESELPYTWNEVVFTQAGTQTATLETVNGCDSVVTMTLTVNPIYNVTDAQTICDNELPYTWNEVVFTQAGTQTATLETVNGCDSVVVMTLTVNPTATATDTKTICASELPYTWNDVEFTQAGTQVAHLQTVNGCDSAVTMTLTVNPTYTVTDTKTICASELPYTWNEVVFTQAGSQTVTLETVNGCDSVVTMTLTVNPIYAVTDTKTICASELPYTWNEVVFTQAGTQTATLETVNGCDSVVTMTLTVNPIYNVTDAQTICASELPYTWNEVVFTQAGTQTATLQTVNGCDSVVVMTLTVNPTATASDAQTICASELPYTWNGVTFTQAGTQVAHLQTVNGCDSAVTMTLTVNPTYEVTDVKTICASELPYTWNGVAFTQAGTQIAHLQTVNGCDSAVTMTLNVNPVYNVTEEQSICESELPYTWNGIVFTQAGSQTVTLQTVNGCDSVVTMILTVNQPTTGVDVQEACDSFTWIDGVTYTESTSATNAPTYVLTNAAGCDSVVTLDLTINHSVTVEYSLVISEDDLPYTIGDTTFDPSTIQSGDYTFYLTTAAGCDSIIILHLTVTGVEDYLMSVNMNVYPNPTTDKINIQISTMNHEQLLGTEIQLYDMYGKWLSTWKVTGETTEIDLSSYAASVYFIKAVNGKRQVGVRKIVKQ
jgi:hypothetical protein